VRDVYIFISVRIYTCMQEHRGSCIMSPKTGT